MMASNDNQQLNIEQARELLSPYLDGEISAEERVLVEESLAASRELRVELETLRQTVSLLQALPSVPAPRPFTLSEADLGISAPAGRPRTLFGLPAWLAGLAGVVASLVCVLAVGGLLFAQQFGGGLSAPAELAGINENVAPQAAQSEAESVEQAVEGPAREVAPAEPAAPMTEEKAAESALDEAPAAPEPEVEQEESLRLEVEEPTAAEAAEDTLSTAGEAAEAEEGRGETFRNGEAGGDAIAGIAPTPTPAPLSTPEQPALTAPTAAAPAEKAMPAEAPAAAEAEEAPAEEAPPELAESAPPPAEAEASQEQNLAQGGATPRPVEIRNQNLSVRPGLIRLAGVIEAKPGTVLQASLWRNNEPFDDWVTPPGLQTVVQPGGQFVFEFDTPAGRTDQDLFGLEPASYQIVITSVGVDAPVTAVVFFDTNGPPATVESPTVTPTPAPPITPTAVARVTVEPSPTPAPVASPTGPPALSTAATGPPQASPTRSLPLLLVIVVIVGLGGLLGAGLLVWWLIKKQQN